MRLSRKDKFFKLKNKVQYSKYENLCVFLTCANDKEADKISLTLLKKKLIACVKKFPVVSSFLFKGKVDNANEVLLIMDSTEGKFADIEKAVAKIHSYETFVLFSLPVTQITQGVMGWIKQELK